MILYKNWKIEESKYAAGYFVAYKLNDCDEFMKWDKSIEDLKIEIDEEE